ncbi:MAG: Rieske 2Fe-2S domain-containing protein [Dehalococcoidia bacterium]
MLSVEANMRLTQVGPGTPMGELMRRYWQPIRPYAQLVEEDVLPVRILGEDLVLFMTLKGDMGLVHNRCPHRQTGLQYGIPDDEGLRCAYHGWLTGPTGQCLDTPLEAADSTFKERIKIKAYPVQELGGLVWAYMGPGEPPLLPRWDLFVLPNAIRQIGITEIPCNWLQCHENTGDPTHSVWLHGELFKYVLKKQGKLDERAGDAKMHTLYSRIKAGIGIESLYAFPTQYGIEKGIKYSKALGADRDEAHRHATVIFPFFTQTGEMSSVRHEFQIRVPIDDTHTYHIAYGCYTAPPEVKAPEQDVIPWYTVPSHDEDGKPILDYVLAQDALAWWSQGELTDRSKEKLGRTDTPIILLRRQFEEQIRIVEDGGEPMNVFRDAGAMPSILHGGRWDAEDRVAGGQLTSFRSNYHKGYGIDDGDRYGPMMPQIIELMREIDEFRQAKA